MGLKNIRYEDGQTPLDPDEIDGLIIPTVSTRGELDEVEQRNVEEAVLWTVSRRKRFTIDEVLCFSNGNGRHSRLMADIIIEKLLGTQVFTWGSESLVQQSEFRGMYLTALRNADLGNVEDLVVFARS